MPTMPTLQPAETHKFHNFSSRQTIQVPGARLHVAPGSFPEPEPASYPFYPPELHFPTWSVDIAAPENGYLLLTNAGYKVEEIVKAKPAAASESPVAADGVAPTNEAHRLAVPINDKAAKTLLTNDSLPLVFIDSRVLMEVQYIVNRMAPVTGECGGYFMSRRLDESKPHFLVHDYFLVGQDATGGEVALDGLDGKKYFEHINEHYKDKFSSKFHNLLGHWHSHGRLGAFLSSTDIKQQETYGQLGYMGDYRIFMVFNAEYKIRASLVVYSPVFQRYDDIPIGVYTNPAGDTPRSLTRARIKALDAQMDAQIKRRVYTPSTQYGGQGWGWGGGGSGWSWGGGRAGGNTYGYDRGRGYAWARRDGNPSLFHGLNTEYPGELGYDEAYAGELDAAIAALTSDDGPQVPAAKDAAVNKMELLLEDEPRLRVIVAEALRRLFTEETVDAAVPAKYPAEVYTACDVYAEWYAQAGYADDVCKRAAVRLANAFAGYADFIYECDSLPAETMQQFYCAPIDIVETIAGELYDPSVELGPPAREVLKQLLLYGPKNIDLSNSGGLPGKRRQQPVAPGGRQPGGAQAHQHRPPGSGPPRGQDHQVGGHHRLRPGICPGIPGGKERAAPGAGRHRPAPVCQNQGLVLG